MTVITREHRERWVHKRRDDGGRAQWLDIGGPAGRTLFVGGEFGGQRLDEPGDVAPLNPPPTPIRRPVPDVVPGAEPGDGQQVRTGPRRRRTSGSAVACAGPAGPSLRGARLTRRGRLVVALAWLALAVIAAVPIVDAAASEAGSAGPVTDTVGVTEGDTLWDIARAVDPHGDPRDTMHTIIGLNDLGSAGGIRAGDRLVVPVVP